nr:F-box domain, leucine-rich repeat domain, L domain-like protein [Tanacetum cinerariifolium]
MWRRSGGNVLRTLRLASEISILSFGMIPGTLPEPLKIGKTGQRARSYLDRDPVQMQTSTTHEYPSLIDTFFVAHTVNGEFLRDEDRRIHEEMRRLEAMGTYTDNEINRLARGGKQRGHIAGVGRVLPARATASPSTPAHDSTLNSLHKKVDFMMSIFKSDSKYSDMFSQFESGGVSGSDGCGDEEEGADHQDDEDEDDDGDTYYIGEVIRGVPLYYHSWLKVLKERKAALITDIEEEMRRLEAIGTYTDDEINRLARGGKQRGHIADVGRVLPARATASTSMSAHDSTLNHLHKMVDFMMSIFKSDSKYSDMFLQFELGGASGSGGCRDEEEGADHQDDEDEDGDGNA